MEAEVVIQMHTSRFYNKKGLFLINESSHEEEDVRDDKKQLDME